jgi:hypothetical protein
LCSNTNITRQSARSESRLPERRRNTILLHPRRITYAAVGMCTTMAQKPHITFGNGVATFYGATPA